MLSFRRLLPLSLCFLLCLAAGCGNDTPETAGKTPVSITAFNILDQGVIKRNKPLIIRFSEPMVEPGLVDTPLIPDARPFSVIPPVEGEYRWLNVSTAVFVPAKGFARGTRYAVHLKEGLLSAAGNPTTCSFAFKTEALEVQRIESGEYNEERQEYTLFFRFSAPVTVAGLREHLRITDAESGEALETVFDDSGKTSSMQGVVVRLGKARESLIIALREDTADDTEMFGIVPGYKAVLRMPEGGAPARMESSESASASSLDFSYVYSNENALGKIEVNYNLEGYPADQEQKKFIRITPDLPYRLSSYGNIIIEDAPPSTIVTATLLPGLLDKSGKVLKEERSKIFEVPDRRPDVRFDAYNGFLSPVAGGRVGITHTNVDKISLTLHRQYDNNLQLTNLLPDYREKGMMRQILYKEVLLDNTEINKVYRKAVDLEELAEGRRGVYMLSVTGYERSTSSGETYYAYRGSNDMLVVLTDIGVTARVFPSGITVFANALSTAGPLNNALVRVYSNNNQLLAEGRTDANGLFVHKQPAAWDGQLPPAVVVVENGTAEDDHDITFLPLDRTNNISLGNTGERAYLDTGHEAFVYTPRGVFRPGETVDVKAFVRDKDMLPPKPFPVLFTVTSPRGTEAASGSAVLSAEGGADFSFTPSSSALTGRYTVRVSLPGQKDTVFGHCAFNVEDFVPPRLEVAVTPAENTLSGDGSLPLSLSGQYLFGAPGSALSFELGYRALSRTFAHKDWEGYTFGDKERSFSGESKLDYLTGTLDENGLAAPVFTVPGEWQNAPSLLQVQLIAGVQEDGGRWVNNSAMLTYWPTPFLLGLKPDESFNPGREGRIRAAAVAPDGATVDAGPFTVEIFEVQGSWRTLFRDGRYNYVWDEIILPKNKFEQTAVGGVAEFPFTPTDYGRYLVRVSTAGKKVVASCRFSVWGDGGEYGDAGSGRMDTVELALDKISYLAGETAKLSVKAPYAGTLLLGLERNEQTDTRVIPLAGASTVVDIPVTADMAPNITITAWVVRPVQAENREWYSHRAYGTTSLALSREPHTLQVSAVTPEKALPDTPLTVHFTVTDHHGVPVEGEFSAALIDEGILSLTAYSTPNPAAYFTANRRAVGDSYDAFDALLRPEAKAVPLLTAGGDALADYQGSLSTQQIFLTAYQPTVKTDANGQGEITFDVPEYSGKARLMIVGASADRFASGASPVRVARDVTVETSAPRAVAPGDTYAVHLKLFTSLPDEEDAGGKEARIRVEASGPLAFTGETAFTLPLSGNSAAARALEIPVKAADAAGIGRVTVNVEVPGRDDLSYAKTFETVVRPPYPRTGSTASALLKAGKPAVLELPGRRIHGTEKILLTVDRSPVSAVFPMLEYLREYPYGCLEQTTSRAWPYLRLAEVQKALHPDKDAAPEARLMLQDITKRILAMQTPSGGFGAWPGYAEPSPWRSAHATLFLVEAAKQIAVPRPAMDDALGYMRLLLSLPETSFNNDPGYAAAVKAYAAFVLTRAGQPQPAVLQYLSAQEKIMPASGRIFLAGAKALQAGNPKALEALAAAVLQPKAGRYGRTFETDLRNRSLLLYMWALTAPKDNRTARQAVDLAQRLLAVRSFSTQEAGFAALAFGTWLESNPAVPVTDRFTTEVLADGKPVASSGNRRLVLDGATLPLRSDGTPQSITLNTDGKGLLFAVYNVRGIPMDPPAPVSSGIQIQRIWKNAAGETIDLSSGTVRLKKGDRITVELVLQADQPVTDIAVSDLLPGGMEIENPRLAASAAHGTADKTESDEPVSLYTDLREDRLLVFFDAVSRTVRYTYTMRAVSKGTFALPPVAADAMYAPEIQAVTPAGTLVVE